MIRYLYNIDYFQAKRTRVPLISKKREKNTASAIDSGSSGRQT